MATAERFAAANGSYWAGVLPRLEQFVRLSNLGPERFARAIPIDFTPARQAFVSETAFMLWAHPIQTEPMRARVVPAEAAARDRLAELFSATEIEAPLTRSEQAVALLMARRLGEYSMSRRRLQHVEFEPRLPGCGVISSGVPDVVARDVSRHDSPLMIIEVKAVDRTFRSTDYRQLVCYTILYFAARRLLPDVLALVNPLRGTAIEIGVEAFFYDVSGSSADEVVQRLMTEWSALGISL